MGRTLTADLQAAYRRDGFVLIEDAVPPDTLRALRTITERLIEASREIAENDAVYDLDTGHGPDSPRLNRIKTPHLVDPATTATSARARCSRWSVPCSGRTSGCTTRS